MKHLLCFWQCLSSPSCWMCAPSLQADTAGSGRPGPGGQLTWPVSHLCPSPFLGLHTHLSAPGTPQTLCLALWIRPFCLVFIMDLNINVTAGPCNCLDIIPASLPFPKLKPWEPPSGKQFPAPPLQIDRGHPADSSRAVYIVYILFV